MLVGTLHEPPKWRVAIALSRRDLGGEEAGIVVPGCGLNAKVIRVERLDQHAARQITAPGTSRHLREQCEGSLRGAKVRQEQRHIRRDHTYQRHSRQIQALGDHLRTYKNVRSPVGEGSEE